MTVVTVRTEITLRFSFAADYRPEICCRLSLRLLRWLRKEKRRLVHFNPVSKTERPSVVNRPFSDGNIEIFLSIFPVTPQLGEFRGKTKEMLNFWFRKGFDGVS